MSEFFTLDFWHVTVWKLDACHEAHQFNNQVVILWTSAQNVTGM